MRVTRRKIREGRQLTLVDAAGILLVSATVSLCLMVLVRCAG